MAASSFLVVALAGLIGISLGVLGSGGSIVTLPVLVYVAGIPAQEAVGMSLAIVGATSLFGGLLQLRARNLDLKAALIFSATGMIGAFLGSTGTHFLSKAGLMLLFGAIMLVVGSLMFRRPRESTTIRVCSTPRCLFAGFGVGLLTGFLGVGGGSLIVPTLMLTAGLTARRAGGTSLAVIAMNSATGLVGQLRFVALDWGFLSGFLAAAFLGMLMGLTIAKHLNDRILRRVFSSTLIALGTLIAFKNLT